MQKSKNKLWTFFTLLIAAWIAMPVIYILLSLIGPADPAWDHIKTTVLPDYIKNTLLLMFLVGVFSTLIGVSTAWFVAATEFPGRGFFSWALVLPLASPGYIIAYIYTDLLDFSGPVQSFLRQTTGWEYGDYWFPEIRSLTGAAVMLSLVLYPYIYLLARISFRQNSSTLFDAARNLGAGSVRIFFRVALPLARPAIIGGVTLVMMETLADFGVVEFFGVPTFSTGIFRVWFAMGEQQTALKLAAMMLIVVVALLFLEKAGYPERTRVSFAGDYGDWSIKLSPFIKSLAFLICFLPLLLGLGVPMMVLAYYAITVGDPMLTNGFGTYVWNSLSVAGAATVITVFLAVFLSYAERINPTPSVRYGIRFATLGYALPGTILAIGLLGPISGFDHFLADFLNEGLGIQSGLLLTGTVAMLIYAYVIRFLTVAYNGSSSGFGQIPLKYDAVARSLGASRWRLAVRIHLPLLKGAVTAAAMLVFVDVMRELPATLMLRPFNFETLSTRVYRLASDERIGEASTAAIVIIVIGLIPVFILNKLNNKN